MNTGIAQEYMDKMGYGNQPYLVYKHEDIDRHHLHIVSVRVDENGKNLNDSSEKRRSEEVRKELEQKYKLIPAEKQKQSSSLPIKSVNIKEGNIKIFIIEFLFAWLIFITLTHNKYIVRFVILSEEEK